MDPLGIHDGRPVVKPLSELDLLLTEVRACRLCESQLPMGPRPVLRASTGARAGRAGRSS